MVRFGRSHLGGRRSRIELRLFPDVVRAWMGGSGGCSTSVIWKRVMTGLTFEVGIDELETAFPDFLPSWGVRGNFG